MKTIKLKSKDDNDAPDEEIEMSLDDTDIKKLKFYIENFERFRTAKFIMKGIPELKGISAMEDGVLSIEFTEFDYSDVYELLHLARPIFLSKEPASFEKTCSILGKKGKGTALAKHLKSIRTLYEKGEYQLFFQLSIDDIPLFHQDTLNNWLNGIEYHQDDEKRKQIKELENILSPDTARGTFVSQLGGRIKAAFRLAYVVGLVITAYEA